MQETKKPDTQPSTDEPATRTGGTEQSDEVSRIRERLKKEGKTEQQINLYIAQAEMLGEL